MQATRWIVSTEQWIVHAHDTVSFALYSHEGNLLTHGWILLVRLNLHSRGPMEGCVMFYSPPTAVFR